MHLPEKEKLQLRALLDTCSKFNLCKRELIPPEAWKRAERPVTFVAANQSVVTDGDQEVTCDLEFKGLQCR